MNELPSSGWLEQLRFFTGRRRVVEVVNESMLPVMRPGDTLLYNPRAYRERRPTVGDLVVLQHPLRPGMRIVKRISAVLPTGELEVRGENVARSDDSRHFGPVSPTTLSGRITSRLP